MQGKIGKSNKKQVNAVQNLSSRSATKAPQKTYNRKSRAKYECSDELAEMIEQANLIKKEFSFSIDDFLKDLDTVQSLVISWYEFFFSLPKDIQYFVFQSEESLDYEKQDGYEFWVNNDG